MMKLFRRVFFVVLVLVFSMNVYGFEIGPFRISNVRNDWHRVKLLKISDGDTFIVLDHGKKVKLRLLYIDTPEKFNSYKLKKDVLKCKVSKKKMRKLGILSSNYAKKYFKGQKYILVKYFKKGHYKRMLALVKRIDKDSVYNYDIIKDGYSCVYRKARYPKEYKKALDYAKYNRLGLFNKYYDIMNCLCYK